MIDELDALVYRQPTSFHGYDAVPENKKIAAIPPKIVVHLFVHEEVTSFNNHPDLTSDALIDGTINVKLISSDASNNVPFRIAASSLQHGGIPLNFSSEVTFIDDGHTFIKVPKSMKGQVKVADYRFAMKQLSMPLHLERCLYPLGHDDKRFSLSIKLKSKHGDDLFGQNICNVALIVALPPTVIGNSINIVKGTSSTTLDDLRRLLKVKIHSLSHDDDVVLNAEFSVIPHLDAALDGKQFPILLRCESIESSLSDLSFGLSHRDMTKGVSIIEHHSYQLWYRMP